MVFVCLVLTIKAFGINMTDRYMKDGKVAVLISYGYGAGWSSWNRDHPQLAFDPTIVEMVLKHNELEGDDRIDDIDRFMQELDSYVEVNYPGTFTGGAYDLDVMWLNPGEKFKITEYDGYESITIASEEKWTIA